MAPSCGVGRLSAGGSGLFFFRKALSSLPSCGAKESVTLCSMIIHPSQKSVVHGATHLVCRLCPDSIPLLRPFARESATKQQTCRHTYRHPLLPLFTPCVAAPSSAAGLAIQRQQTSAAAGIAQHQQRRSMSSEEVYPTELTRGTQGSMDIPVGGQGLYRRGTNIGMPMLFVMRYDRPTWQPLWEDEHEEIPRDGFGVPAHIPPEVSQDIKHVYHVPPQFYHFLKKLGDDTPALQPYMHKLINGEFTHDDYEEMFYKFAKPLKIYRKQIPMPYRTPEEVAREDEVAWEGAWLSYRQRVLACYNSAMYLRELVFGGLVGIYFAWLFLDGHRQYRLDMKLFYLEAPEHKINWVKPRGDLV